MLFMTEEESYWMVSTVCEDLLPNYYVPSMIGCTTDQAVFEFLLQDRMPALHDHLAATNIPLTLITIPWLLCIFIGFLSWEATLRVLDCFFYEGRHVLFQIGLGIFRIYQTDILATEDPVEIIEILKHSNVECERLFQVAFDDFADLDKEEIDKLHKLYRSRVVSDLMQKLNKRKQTAALHFPQRLAKPHRTGSIELRWSSEEISEPPLPVETRRGKVRHTSSSSDLTLSSVSKTVSSARKKLQQVGTDAIFSFRSSSQQPIKFSPAFKPQEDHENK